MHLITHVFNEEFLLPYWIKHHVPMFDSGTVIDYASTDNSIDIVRQLAPNWDIVPSCNKWFIEPDIGEEVMRIERKNKGWKLVLNVTEFLFHDDIRGYCQELEKNGEKSICTTGVIMVDRPSERNCFNEKPLVLQKTFGYFEEDVIEKPSTTLMKIVSRSRLLHCFNDGQYKPGRHFNKHTDKKDPELFLCWFGWSPFDAIKERKMQIQHKVPEEQKKIVGWRKIYCVDGDDLEKMYEQEHMRSYNLLDNVAYKKMYESFANNV